MLATGACCKTSSISAYNKHPPKPLGCGRADNVLKHAPHTAEVVMAGDWSRPYSRERAAFPATWVRQAKFWPSTSRVDNVFGDRKLIARLPEGETRAVGVGE